MRKPQPPEGRRPSAALAALLFGALAACVLSPPAAAQSGRRKPGSPPPATTGAGTKTTAEAKPRTAALSLVVMAEETSAFDVDTFTRRVVEDGFTSRLGGVSSVAMTRAGRGSRKAARDRAKAETEAYVVLLQIEDDSMGPSTTRTSRDNSRMLVLHTFIYAPKTGDLKFNDATYQRNLRPSVGVGGVRLPVPNSGRRYPSEYELRQVANDAADRVLSRLQITPPPDNR